MLRLVFLAVQMRFLPVRSTFRPVSSLVPSGNSSGDLIVSFSTAIAETNHAEQASPSAIQPLANLAIDPLCKGAAEASEEAIVNALVAAETMTGADGTRVHGLPHDELRAILKRYNRLEDATR